MLQSPQYLVLPGESIPITSLTHHQKVKTCRKDLDITKDLQINPKHFGFLIVEEDKIIINQNPVNYFPEVDDYVIVQITGKNSEFYYCDLGNGLNYNLNQMDFEGATKKNKPNLHVGQYLFARITETNHYLKGKLSCINPNSKKEWTTGENLFRELVDGVVIDVPNHFSNALLTKQQKPPIFKELAKSTTFEVCVGKNGKIWIKGLDAVLIINILKKAYSMNEQDQIKLVQSFSCLFVA